MIFKQYPLYKDSNISWLNKVPKHWEVIKLKKVAFLKSGESITAENIHAKGEYPVYGGNGLRGYTDSFTHAGNFILIGRQGALCGNINYAKNNFWASEHAIVVTPLRKTNIMWLGELFRSMNLNQYSLSSAQPGLSVSTIHDLYIPYPPYDEQNLIEVFLNRNLKKFDMLIAGQKKLIALLTEKRQAIISHAVTKGLEPNVPMKDSGVAWVGEIPAHWNIRSFKNCIDFQEGPGILASDFISDGIPLIRISGMQRKYVSLDGCNYLDPNKVSSRWNHFRLKKDDLLISASASMGMICEVDEKIEGAIAYTGLIRLRAKENFILKSYIKLFINSILFLTQIDFAKTGATIQHFGPTHLNKMFILLPSLSEQYHIIAKIDRETSKIDKLIIEVNRAIELLKERRTALISAAVTGKIDVRDITPDLPMEVSPDVQLTPGTPL